MSATRSRKEEKMYDQHLRSSDPDACPFCAVKKQDRDYYEETKSFKVIQNIFPYSIWDGQTVVDHLMVTPKKHTDSLAGMSSSQKVEYVDILEKYEKQGYNVYSRAPVSVIKSVTHQHTHLIKTVGSPKRFIFLLRRPYYIRLVR